MLKARLLFLVNYSKPTKKLGRFITCTGFQGGGVGRGSNFLRVEECCANKYSLKNLKMTYTRKRGPNLPSHIVKKSHDRIIQPPTDPRPVSHLLVHPTGVNL